MKIRYFLLLCIASMVSAHFAFISADTWRGYNATGGEALILFLPFLVPFGLKLTRDYIEVFKEILKEVKDGEKNQQRI